MQKGEKTDRHIDVEECEVDSIYSDICFAPLGNVSPTYVLIGGTRIGMVKRTQLLCISAARYLVPDP